jgi:hypothetical protein
MAGDTIRGGAVIDGDPAPIFRVVTAAASLRGMPVRRCVAGLAVGVVGVIEPGHHPIVDRVAVGTHARVVIGRCIRGMAICALPVEVMSVINVAPIAAGIVAAAAVLAVVVGGRFTLVAIQALLN